MKHDSISASSRASSRLLLVAGAVLFSTGGAAIKAVSLSGQQIASLRSGIAVAALLFLIPSARRGWSWRTLLVGAAYASTMVLFVLANKLTTAAHTIFLQATAPVYMLALGPLVLKERLRRADLVFAAVLVLALLMLFHGSVRPDATAPDPLRGNVLAALSGVAWALTITGLRWLARKAKPGDDPAIATVAAGNAIAFLACLPLALPVQNAGWRDLAVLAYLGMFQIGLAYVAVTRGLRHVPAFEASALLLVEPALNPVWAWLVQGEQPGAWAVAGGALIIGATLAKTWEQGRAVASSKATAQPL